MPAVRKTVCGNDPDGRSYCLLAGVFLVCFAVLFKPFNGAGYDPVGYYTYLSSFMFDGDVDIENDWALSHSHHSIVINKLSLIGPKGLVKNEYAIGTSILWFPFYLPVRTVAWCQNLFLDTPPAWVNDRYGTP